MKANSADPSIPPTLNAELKEKINVTIYIMTVCQNYLVIQREFLTDQCVLKS